MKYKDSGVDIERGKKAKKAMAKHVSSTWGPEVLSDTGAFGGLFRLGPGYDDPVLVGSVDGVGTKLIAARMADRYDTVGQDLVNHCVDDILVQGARPLFFLDYIASGSLSTEVVASVIEGITIACRAHRCALIGGETAEMPDVYQGEDFDLAGCIVGVVNRAAIIDGSGIKPGDRILGLPSNGLHTNGYSLVRKIIFEKLGLRINDFVSELGCTVAEELLKIHRSYLDAYDKICSVAAVKGLAHITGGGIVDNLSRILPKDCNAVIRKGSWPVLSVFGFLQSRGEVDPKEMYHVFNMGLGMLVVVS
ncbi:MAG: phosphoribosylformylglycinamidine cyclo-ligase, partial [Candidatus Latescibacterota bacterium]